MSHSVPCTLISDKTKLHAGECYLMFTTSDTLFGCNIPVPIYGIYSTFFHIPMFIPCDPETMHFTVNFPIICIGSRFQFIPMY